MNHAFYWQNMSPPSDPNAQREPTGPLLERIKANFGSFDALKQKITEAAAGLFGSGRHISSLIYLYYLILQRMGLAC